MGCPAPKNLLLMAVALEQCVWWGVLKASEQNFNPVISKPMMETTSSQDVLPLPQHP